MVLKIKEENMQNIKYVLGTAGDTPVKELLGIEEVVTESNDKGLVKAVISYKSEQKDNKVGIDFGNGVAAVSTVTETIPEGYELLKVRTYNIKMADKTVITFDSIYDLSVNAIAHRVFSKAIAPFKAKYAPKRQSMASETKAKLNAEMAAYRAMQKKSAAPVVEEGAEY